MDRLQHALEPVWPRRFCRLVDICHNRPVDHLRDIRTPEKGKEARALRGVKDIRNDNAVLVLLQLCDLQLEDAFFQAELLC